MGFMNLEKAYHKVNREALWQVLRLLLLLKSNPSRQHSEVYAFGSKRKGRL